MINPINLDSRLNESNKNSGVSSRADQSSFQNALGVPSFSGNTLGGFSSASSQHQLSRSAAAEGMRLVVEQSRDSIMEQVVNKKNQMILESRGNAAKKAAEIAKEISF